MVPTYFGISYPLTTELQWALDDCSLVLFGLTMTDVLLKTYLYNLCTAHTRGPRVLNLASGFFTLWPGRTQQLHGWTATISNPFGNTRVFLCLYLDLFICLARLFANKTNDMCLNFEWRELDMAWSHQLDRKPTVVN